MKHKFLNFPEEFSGIKQIKYAGTTYINNNYAYADKETELIYFQPKEVIYDR